MTIRILNILGGGHEFTGSTDSNPGLAGAEIGDMTYLSKTEVDEWDTLSLSSNHGESFGIVTKVGINPFSGYTIISVRTKERRVRIL